MITNDLENSNFVVSHDISIKEAMSIITTNHRGCVVVVDEHKHLVGVLSDGDIRRSLIKGVSMLSNIENTINRNPIFLKNDVPNLEEESDKIFSSRPGINLVPVVDNDNILVSLITQN
jgi:CBS domain-containing protein